MSSQTERVVNVNPGQSEAPEHPVDTAMTNKAEEVVNVNPGQFETSEHQVDTAMTNKSELAAGEIDTANGGGSKLEFGEVDTAIECKLQRMDQLVPFMGGGGNTANGEHSGGELGGADIPMTQEDINIAKGLDIPDPAKDNVQPKKARNLSPGYVEITVNRRGHDWEVIKTILDGKLRRIGKYKYQVAVYVVATHGGSQWFKKMNVEHGAPEDDMAAFLIPTPDALKGGRAARSRATDQAQASLIRKTVRTERNEAFEAHHLFIAKYKVCVNHKKIRAALNEFFYQRGLERAENDGCEKEYKALPSMYPEDESKETGEFYVNHYKA